jgi:hypothetical protein
MGKKQVAVSLRKPPPSDRDAFVAGQEPAPAPAPVAPAEPRVAEGPVVASRVGERREITVYLPTDLARQLSLRCLELDRDVSNVVSEALQKSLSTEAPVPVAMPTDMWTRARALVAELGARLPPRLRFGFV